MRPPGRPKTIDDVVAVRMFESGIPATQIAKWMGCTRGAVYHAIRRAKGIDSPPDRTQELTEALESLRIYDGHFTDKCAKNRLEGKACPLRCRKAMAALRKD